MTTLLVSSFALAQNNTAQPRTSDKVDLKKLEDKYWSAKDDDYGVIQNRTFSKAGRIYLTGAYGPVVNDPFAKASMMGVYGGYYFTEDFGVEGSYLIADSNKSDSVSKFNSLTTAGVSPNYNLPGNSYSISAVYTPFYAKMAFMNMAIMYFDMGVTLGAGVSNYNQVVAKKDPVTTAIVGEEKVSQSAPHIEIGIMQQLFVSRSFAIRLDIKNKFHNETTVPYNPGVSSSSEDKMSSDTIITVGATLFLN